MRKFTYCDPFEKKDFESDDGWSLNEEVKISNNVVQKMKAIFFGETMSMSLATSLRAMINQEQKINTPKKVFSVLRKDKEDKEKNPRLGLFI